jgi:hypothetical protein
VDLGRQAFIHLSFFFLVLGVTASVLLVFFPFLSFLLLCIYIFNSFSFVYLGNRNYGLGGYLGALVYGVHLIIKEDIWDKGVLLFRYFAFFSLCLSRRVSASCHYLHTVLLSIIMTQGFWGDINIHWLS